MLIFCRDSFTWRSQGLEADSDGVVRSPLSAYSSIYFGEQARSLFIVFVKFGLVGEKIDL